MKRRNGLLAGVGTAALVATTATRFGASIMPNAGSQETFKISKPGTTSGARGSARYAVLREEGTERAGSSPLDREKRAGIYRCAVCDLAVYSFSDKFDSSTGWPSFTRRYRKEAGQGLLPRAYRRRRRCQPNCPFSRVTAAPAVRDSIATACSTIIRSDGLSRSALMPRPLTTIQAWPGRTASTET